MSVENLTNKPSQAQCSLFSCQLHLAVEGLFKGGGYEQHVSATAQREKRRDEKQQPHNTGERE